MPMTISSLRTQPQYQTMHWHVDVLALTEQGRMGAPVPMQLV